MAEPRWFPRGGHDIFVASHGPGGVHRFSFSVGGASTDRAHAMAVDRSGNIALAGQFQGTVDLGGEPVTSSYVIDAYVASYDASGAYRFARTFGGGFTDVANGVAVEAQGSLLVTGQFQGTADFGGGPVTVSGGTDAYVV